MRVDELRRRVQGDGYEVDVRLVAEALLQRPAPRRALMPLTRRGARGPAGPKAPPMRRRP
jgi:hypothetical protein